MTRSSRRAYIDAPYLDEHADSARRQRDALGPDPGFNRLLGWFLAGFAAETPEAVHAGGTWFGRPPRLDASGHPVEEIASHDPGTDAVVSNAQELTGGSHLGSPRIAEPFRQFLENSPRQTAGDGIDEHYVRPMRAALDRMAGRGEHAPLMARFLLQVAYAQGDWSSVAARWFPIYPMVWRAFTADALRKLYRAYRSEPPLRYLDTSAAWVDLSESQRAAIVAGENMEATA